MLKIRFTMRRLLIELGFLPTVLLAIAGCGTSHQFLPAQPLEKKQWQVSIVWHYDVNGLQRPRSLVLPEFNAYVGVGKNYNFGFGASLPIFINHLTLARYYREVGDNYWSCFGHLNHILGPYNNPVIELGGMYSVRRGWLKHSFALGLGYALPRAWEGGALMGGANTLRVAPFVKYTATTHDVGISYEHYHGLTRGAIGWLSDSVVRRNDTIVSISAGRVIEVAHRSDAYSFYRGLQIARTIILNSGDSIVLRPPRVYCDQFYSPQEELQYWLGKEYCLYYVNDSVMIIDTKEHVEKWQEGEPLIITRFPEKLKQKIQKINSFTADNSFGVSLKFESHPR